ncbi:MAG: hypothetical protein BGP25_16000 [Lysobacterales bacterium 63-13]|nr:MAG: hypothetical protein BGP25_16000 [Xanthomonadales bacterium 63-13]
MRQAEVGPYSAQNAYAKHITVAPLNQGRQASSAVRLAIQAPLIPRTTKTSGTTQHTEAPMAASAATHKAGIGDLAFGLVMRAY